MKTRNKLRDPAIIAAILLLAMNLLWILNLVWGAVLMAEHRSTTWPLYPVSYDLEVISKDEFAQLSDRSVKEIQFANGRTFTRTANWHPKLLEYYGPINDGDQFVKLAVNNDVIQDLRGGDALKLFIATIPTLVLSLWNLAIAVRRRVDDEHPTVVRSQPSATAAEHQPQTTSDSSMVTDKDGIVRVQLVMPFRIFTRRTVGVASILISIALGVVIYVLWGRHGALFTFLPLYVIVPMSSIGLLALFTKRSSGSLVGAAVGCIFVIAPPFAMLIYDTYFAAPGGGANIGLGLMLLAAPVIAPVAAVMGGLIGGEVGRIFSRK